MSLYRLKETLISYSFLSSLFFLILILILIFNFVICICIIISNVSKEKEERGSAEGERRRSVDKLSSAELGLKVSSFKIFTMCNSVQVEKLINIDVAHVHCWHANALDFDDS